MNRADKKKKYSENAQAYLRWLEQTLNELKIARDNYLRSKKKS